MAFDPAQSGGAGQRVSAVAARENSKIPGCRPAAPDRAARQHGSGRKAVRQPLAAHHYCQTGRIRRAKTVSGRASPKSAPPNRASPDPEPRSDSQRGARGGRGACPDRPAISTAPRMNRPRGRRAPSRRCSIAARPSTDGSCPSMPTRLFVPPRARPTCCWSSASWRSAKRFICAIWPSRMPRYRSPARAGSNLAVRDLPARRSCCSTTRLRLVRAGGRLAQPGATIGRAGGRDPGGGGLRPGAAQCQPVGAGDRAPDPQSGASATRTRVIASAASPAQSQIACQFANVSLNAM